jgi:pyruvate/2-oxoglutarate dehydrogenase complex dihydrolipoamide dehydrogenase (E3) component
MPPPPTGYLSPSAGPASHHGYSATSLTAARVGIAQTAHRRRLPVTLDAPGVRAWAVASRRPAIEREIAVHLERYKSTGVELMMGSGRFIAPKALEVQTIDGETRILTGDQVFLNLGSHAAMPDIPGLSAAAPLSHIEALELAVVPSHLAILGGGYVALEMAQAYCRFGSRVTVIEDRPRIMSREDPDVADEVQRILSEEGVEFLVGARTVAVEGRSGDKVMLSLRTASGDRHIEASDLLVAAGRIPNTAAIGLDTAGIETDARGYIRVNERREATAPDVWAIGECAGSPHFTHVSVDDFRIVRDNLAGGNRTTHDRLVPYCPIPCLPMWD